MEAGYQPPTQSPAMQRTGPRGGQPGPKINPISVRYAHVKGEMARIGILAGAFLVLLIVLAIASPRLFP